MKTLNSSTRYSLHTTCLRPALSLHHHRPIFLFYLNFQVEILNIHIKMCIIKKEQIKKNYVAVKKLFHVNVTY